MVDNTSKIINEFINLNLLNDHQDFDSFSEFIQTENVVSKTKSLISVLNLDINYKLLLSIWLIFKYHEFILNHNLQIEKNILKYSSKIIKNIYKYSTNFNSNKINSLLSRFKKDFLLWKNYDKNYCLKEFIQRYVNVSQSIELISDKYNDYTNQSMLVSLQGQLEDILNLASKFDKNFNHKFFKNYYNIHKTVETNMKEAYWNLALQEFNNFNYEIFFQNLSLIKNTLLHFYQNNNELFNFINDEPLLNIELLKNNFFINNNLNQKNYNNENNNIKIFNKDLFIKLYLFVFNVWINLSAPIRDDNFSYYIEQLENINDNNYNQKLIDFLKFNFTIIQEIYLDLTIFSTYIK